LIAKGLETATPTSGTTTQTPKRAAQGPDSTAGTSRDPNVRLRNRRLAILCVGICLVMAACGFVYVRWLMTLPPGTLKETQAKPTRGH